MKAKVMVNYISRDVHCIVINIFLPCTVGMLWFLFKCTVEVFSVPKHDCNFGIWRVIDED